MFRTLRGCRIALFPLGLIFSTRPAHAQTREPFRDPRRPVAERVRDLLERMTSEEKFWQLFMAPGNLDNPAHDYSHGAFGLQIVPQDSASGARAHAERINAVQRYFVEHTRLGIPIIPFDEALHGLGRPDATVFPQAIALAATWDTALMARVSGAIARETGSRGIRDVLSPVANIASDVRWGRVEETYGEDPYLASAMARAFVSPFERAGIVTTPKHFIANVGEGGRDSYPIETGERQLRELFFPPFESALHAGARSVMTAYNSVDGLPATQNGRLLNGILKREWGFTGFVISDAAATGGATVLHMTEPNTPTAAQHAWESGLDVVFQSSWEQHRPYWEAVRTGMVAGSVIDAAVARVLRAKFELGLFEHPYANLDSAAWWNGNAEHRAVALDAARASIVLLKNERDALPLGHPASVAVIGTDAVEARLGGYSGPGIGPVSMLDGIRARAGAAVTVRYAPGPGRWLHETAVIPTEQLSSDSGGATVHGLRGEFFDNITLAGEPRLVRTDPRLDFSWTLGSPGLGLARDWYSVRWTGRLTLPAGAARRIGVEGSDGYRLAVDGVTVIDAWVKQSSRRRLADVALLPGHRYDIRLEFYETTGNAHLKLVWDEADDWRGALDSAVAIARQSDVAIVAAGIEEGEFRDRAFLGLPGRQEQLIREVAATGKPVVVVLVGGSAITMPWLDDVAAVLDAWYPGEQGGTAVAEVLFGDVNPAGRLPITFPVAEGQLPLRYNHKPTGRGDDYLDLTGQPLFPFGFGLSYTSFGYSALVIDGTEVRCRVRNIGARAGDEVVQLYLRDELVSVARPVMELKGFRRVHLAPGQETEVVFALGPDELRMLNRELRWVVEPGEFMVMIGSSSRDIRLRGLLTVRGEEVRR
jgi:beta-glucosidase